MNDSSVSLVCAFKVFLLILHRQFGLELNLSLCVNLVEMQK